jgi:steroid delta-isomerase-like uncharacterized protein
MKTNPSFNEALMRKSFDEWNKGNPEFFLRATAPDYALYTPSNSSSPKTREDTVESVKVFWQGFPDIQFEIQDLMAADDKVVVRFVARGTHTGEFMGIPATGRKIEVSAIAISRIEDGKVLEEWEELDMFGLLTQLGGEVRPKSG